MSEPTPSLLDDLMGFASEEPMEETTSDESATAGTAVPGRFAGPPTLQEMLRIRAVQLARADLLWTATSESKPAGWAALRGAYDELRAVLPRLEAPSIDLLSGLTPAERLFRKAVKRATAHKRGTEPLNPVADFVDLAWRYRLHGLKEIKGVKALSATERLRLAGYWNSENQQIFAEAYRGHLIALHDAGKANREVGRMHDLLVAEILKGRS